MIMLVFFVDFKIQESEGGVATSEYILVSVSEKHGLVHNN